MPFVFILLVFHLCHLCLFYRFCIVGYYCIVPITWFLFLCLRLKILFLNDLHFLTFRLPPHPELYRPKRPKLSKWDFFDFFLDFFYLKSWKKSKFQLFLTFWFFLLFLIFLIFFFFKVEKSRNFKTGLPDFVKQGCQIFKTGLPY